MVKRNDVGNSSKNKTSEGMDPLIITQYIETEGGPKMGHDNNITRKGNQCQDQSLHGAAKGKQSKIKGPKSEKVRKGRG